MCIDAGFNSERELRWEQLRSAEAEVSMALLSRDFDTFSAYMADDALVIHNGRRWQGKEKIAVRWSQLLRRCARTFHWKASRFALLERGTVAIVAGLVSESPSHKVIGAFESIQELTDQTRRLLADVASAKREDAAN